MVSLPEWNLNQVIIYQLEVHKYIGFKTLTMNCGQATFKNARTIFFSKLGGTGSSFRSGSKKNSKTILGAARICLPLQVRRGTLMSAERERTWWNSRWMSLTPTLSTSHSIHLCMQARLNKDSTDEDKGAGWRHSGCVIHWSTPSIQALEARG